MVAVTGLALASRRVGVPYAVVPGLPQVTVAPDTVFLVFLPPLVYAAGWLTSLRDFKANLRPIGLLSIGLVLATTVGVAALAHAVIPGLPWAAAFVLGAIVSPTDTVAAGAIFQRVGAPQRVQTVLEGESLVNDATGLIAFRFAVAAVGTGAFSAWEAGSQFVVSSVGGVALGLALAWLLIQVQRRIDDPTIEITLSFLVPYGIYLATEGLHLAATLAADRLHLSSLLPAGGLQLSGVLAVAAAGIYASRRSSETFSPASRFQAIAVWEVVTFVLNGLVFILIGLQLPAIRAGLGGRSPGQLVLLGGLVSLAVVATRIVWVFPATYLPRLFSAHVRRGDPYPGWRNVAVVAWTGMRGLVSLAAALSLPLTVGGGRPFPDRDLIIYLTFCVILVTLVLQGLSLPFLMRRLGVGDDPSIRDAEELAARSHAIETALARLDAIAAEERVWDEAIRYLRARYGKR